MRGEFVIDALMRTDLMAMLPERLVREHPGLRVCAPPVAVAGHEMAMLWHGRVHRDAAHRWLRERIAASVRDRALVPFSSGLQAVGALGRRARWGVCRG